MASSVGIDEDAKTRLDGLRAEIERETGRVVTREQLLGRLIEHAHDSKEALVDSFRPETVPLSEEEAAAFNAGTFSSGTETSEEDIDRILYDDNQSR